MSIFLSLLIRQRYPDRRLQLSWLNATKVLISSDQTSARYLKLRWLFMCISVIIPFRFPTPRYSYPPPVMLRPLEDPAIPSEAVVDDPAPGWLCARRSRAGSHRCAQALGILRCRDVAGQPCIQVIRSVAAAARSASFQAGPLRRWRPPSFLFTPPNLKEAGS